LVKINSKAKCIFTNTQVKMTVDKEVYNKLVQQYNHLQNEQNFILEQRLQQSISAQTLNSFQSINDIMNNNSEVIKSIHESIVNLNEKIQKQTIKPILPLANVQRLNKRESTTRFSCFIYLIVLK
jgi:hypothetical protein